MDAGFDEDEAELGVLVATVALQVLADGHRLLDEHVQVLGDLGGETCFKVFVSVVGVFLRSVGNALKRRERGETRL